MGFRHTLTLAALTIVLSVCAAPCLAIDTIYLVRHAEKVDFWPKEVDRYRPLTAEGVARAQALADLLGDASIVAVYASRTTRALATGMPLAEQAGVPVRVDDDSAERETMDRFLKNLTRKNRGAGAVLVVGHSNTVPQLLVRLGAQPSCYERIGITEVPDGLRIKGYDGLWRVDLNGEGCDRITRRNQRAATSSRPARLPSSHPERP